MEPLVVIINPGVTDNALIRDFLEKQGFVCLDFTDENWATAWLEKESRPCAAIFLGEVSQQLINRVLQSPKWISVPLIKLVPATEDERSKAFQSLNHVLDNLLIKPFRPVTFLERVQQCLRISPIKSPSAIFLDDSQEGNNLIPEVLSQCGLSAVHRPRDADECLELLKRHPEEIALVACDWELPSLKAVETLRFTRQTPKFLSLPFLICTSQDTIEQVKDLQAAEHRYVAWIPRPLEAQKVPGWLGQLVARLKRQAEVASYLGELSLFRTRKHFDHALSLLGHAVKALPDSSALYEALGDLYAEPEMPCEEAERRSKRASAYELAWRTNRYDERVLAKAVEALEALGKHDEVLRVIKQYLQRFGFDDQWRTRLAKVFFQLGDYGAASVELKRVLNLNPSNAEAQAMLQVIASLHAPPAAGKQAA